MSLDDDRSLLQSFISDVYDWLDACYLDLKTARSNWPVFSIVEDLRDVGAEAWRECKRHLPLEDFHRGIMALSESKLVSHGLHGTQLKYKLAVISHHADAPNQRRIIGSVGRRLIEAIDVLLDSLISALGAGTAVKEIKDMLSAQQDA